jgi:hypothetical protein
MTEPRITVDGGEIKLMRKCDYGHCPNPACDCGKIEIHSSCGTALTAMFHVREGVLALYCHDCGGAVGGWRVADDAV